MRSGRTDEIDRGRWGTLAGAAAIALAGLACADVGSAPSFTGTLEVEVVVDGRADAAGVEVSAGGQSAVTGSDGLATLEGVAAGEPLTVRAELDGSAAEDVVTVQPDEVVAVTLTLSVTGGEVSIVDMRAAPSAAVPAGATVTVSVTAEDSAGGALAYLWEATDGWALDDSGDTATVVAPDEPDVAGIVTVTVTSDAGGEASSSVELVTIDCDEADDLECELFAWSTRHPIEIDTSQVAEDLRDVPILLSLDPDVIEYAEAAPDGADLRVVSGALDEFLDHEIDTWDPDGISHVWVRLPELPSGADGADVSLWLFYGNADAEDGQNPPGVWRDDFRAVWHGDVSPDQPDVMLDSTEHQNDAESPLADWTDRIVSGLVGRAVEMVNVVNSDTYFEPPVAQSLDLTEAFTLEAVVNIDPDWEDDPADWAIVLKGPDSNENNTERYYLGISRRELIINCRIFPAADGEQIRNDSPVDVHPGAGAAVPVGVFTYLACTYDGETLAAYVDGDQKQTHSEFSGGPVVGDLGTDRFFIGRRFVDDRHFGGLVDEVRISAVARSDAWIAVQELSFAGELATIGPAQ